MAQQQNQVLKDFLEMRRSLHKSNPVASTAVQANKKMTGKKGGKTSDAILNDEFGITVAKIIEEKPPKKVVCEYFQKEADNLTKEKMK